MQKTIQADKALAHLYKQVSETGFYFADNKLVHNWLTTNNANALSDWDDFATSWNDMPQDQYMADGGRYRRRRHATFSASVNGTIKLEPHQPHYQSLDYNTLNGGIAREYAPIADEVVRSNTMGSILGFCQTIFSQMLPQMAWHIEVHQFRIEANYGQSGQPTPEGIHRDGVDFVLVAMVKRVNISSGTTTMHDLEQRKIDSFTLTEPLDCAVVNDRRCMHGVTAVQQLDPNQAAYRDVLVVTFRSFK